MATRILDFAADEPLDLEPEAANIGRALAFAIPAGLVLWTLIIAVVAAFV